MNIKKPFNSKLIENEVGGYEMRPFRLETKMKSTVQRGNNEL